MGTDKIKNLLWLSDSPVTATGFSSQTRSILNLLQESGEFNCYCLGHNYYSINLVPPITFEDGEKINFTLLGSGRGKYSIDKIPFLIRKYNISLFGGLLDTFMLLEGGFLNCDTSPAKTFWYYPSDGGGGLPTGCDNILRKVNMPIAMSKFAQEQIKKVHNIDSVYIPHGYDKDLFYPLSEEEKKANRTKWLLRNKFVIGVVARNQGRKMLDRTIKAFSLFAKDKEDVRLLMHCDPNDAAQPFRLFELINRYKIRNKVIFTDVSFYNPYNYKQMNEVYNLMDVFLLTTSGEGFGVPIIEAMACGIPQVCTDYTTTKELVIDDIQTGEAVKLVGENNYCPHPHTDEILDGTLTGTYEVERGMMSIYNCVEILNKLYNDRNLLKKYSENSLVKAKKFYSWDMIMPKWIENLRRLLE